MEQQTIWGGLFGWPLLGAIVAVLIGVGIGVLSMTPQHFLIAQFCFAISAAIIFSRTAYWLTFEVSGGANKLTLVVVAFLVFGVTGCALVVSLRWISGLRDLQKQIHIAQQHIQPKLLIDSLGAAGEITAYRLGVTNIGTDSINQVAVRFTTSPVRPLVQVDIPVSTTLPPHGGTVAVPGTDAADLSTRRQLIAIFTFETTINGTSTHFLSSHKFVLPEGALTLGSIDPRSSFEHTGELQSGLQAATANDLSVSLLDALSSTPTGTIEFWAPEKRPNGDPNPIVLYTKRLAIVYDPVNRFAALVPGVTGTPLHISFEQRERHLLVFVWKDGVPHLVAADGKSVTSEISR